MNHLIKFVLLATFMASTGAATAWEHQPKSGAWDVRGEYLALQPMISQSFYAQAVSPLDAFPNGTRFNNDFDYKSAYRLYASYGLCENDFQLIWTHLPKTSQSDSASGPLAPNGGIPIGGVFRFASSKVELEYYAVDALIGLWGRQCNAFRYTFRTGLHYANIKFEEDLIYRLGPGNEHINKRSHARGIGPEVAFEANYDLNFLHCFCPGRFALTSTVKGSLLVNRYKVQFQRDSALTQTQPFSKDASFWDLVPMWDIRIGLSYGYNFRCLKAILEVGYEALSYRNVIDREIFVDTASTGLSMDAFSNASFQGPYVALELIF